MRENNYVAEPWVTMGEVAEHLGVKRTWLYKYGKDLPRYKIGRVYRAKLSDIDEWVRSGKATNPVVKKRKKKEGVPLKDVYRIRVERD